MFNNKLYLLLVEDRCRRRSAGHSDEPRQITGVESDEQFLDGREANKQTGKELFRYPGTPIENIRLNYVGESTERTLNIPYKR